MYIPISLLRSPLVKEINTAYEKVATFQPSKQNIVWWIILVITGIKINKVK